MKIYTSFYGNRYLPEDAFLVQIATTRPKGMKVDCVWTRVMPDYDTMVAPVKPHTTKVACFPNRS